MKEIKGKRKCNYVLYTISAINKNELLVQRELWSLMIVCIGFCFRQNACIPFKRNGL